MAGTTSVASGSASPITVQDLRDAPVDSILRAAEEAHASGEQLGEHGHKIHDLTTWSDEWSGDAATIACYRLRASGQNMYVIGKTTSASSTVVSSFGRTIGSLASTVRGPASFVERMGYSISPNGDITGGKAVAPGWLLPIEVVLRAAVMAARAAERLASSAMSSLLESLSGQANAPELEGQQRQAAQPGAELLLPSQVPVRVEERGEGPVIYAGDVESASEIITLVSGVGSDKESSYQSNAAWARQQVALAAARGESLAVVAWHDYDAPEGLKVGASGQRARGGADRLREFQSDLRQSNPDARLHAVGHSYGTVVIGQAARRGLEADRVTSWGSPGMGVSKRSQLHLSQGTDAGARAGDHVRQSENFEAPGEIVTEMIAGDPIAYAIGVHGPDPALLGKGPGWGTLLWRGLMDGLVMRKGAEAHSYYRWDPAVTERLAMSGRG